ncbi:hypothetical protein F2P44_04050 [Massilia sp. CCM 8695]|uniref:HNH endonuclease n=1 Tax=Massilia frigida TaxID=2609281 RepID=A0ABX0NDB8_9BURK|nr:hypothetical protein [Massilia frigida]NHZ78460.1 hypothetical protein [Massilia frigida]
MPRGNCRLCHEESELKLSHVVPAFVFRWQRESSGNGHLRMASAPNRRVQDGPKLHWLCDNCETLLSLSEGMFSNKIFHPLILDAGRPVRYAEWMMHFCTSLSWRVLQYFMTEVEAKERTQEQIEQMALAEKAWREVLLGQRKHAGVFEQHFLPFDQIQNTTGTFPPNINRYLMRAVQIDLCFSEKGLYTYAKLGRFIILGFVHEPTPRHWIGTKVHATEGAIGPRDYTVPRGFGRYLNAKASQAAKSLASMSASQHDKVVQAFKQNIDKIDGSDLFVAMQADVAMFGDKAFIQNMPATKNS